MRLQVLTHPGRYTGLIECWDQTDYEKRHYYIDAVRLKGNPVIGDVYPALREKEQSYNILIGEKNENSMPYDGHPSFQPGDRVSLIFTDSRRPPSEFYWWQMLKECGVIKATIRQRADEDSPFDWILTLDESIQHENYGLRKVAWVKEEGINHEKP